MYCRDSDTFLKFVLKGSSMVFKHVRKHGTDHRPFLKEEKRHEKGAGEKRVPAKGKQGREPCLP